MRERSVCGASCARLLPARDPTRRFRCERASIALDQTGRVPACASSRRAGTVIAAVELVGLIPGSDLDRPLHRLPAVEPPRRGIDHRGAGRQGAALVARGSDAVVPGRAGAGETGATTQRSQLILAMVPSLEGAPAVEGPSPVRPSTKPVADVPTRHPRATGARRRVGGGVARRCHRRKRWMAPQHVSDIRAPARGDVESRRTSLARAGRALARPRRASARWRRMRRRSRSDIPPDPELLAVPQGVLEALGTSPRSHRRRPSPPWWRRRAPGRTGRGRLRGSWLVPANAGLRHRHRAGSTSLSSAAPSLSSCRTASRWRLPGPVRP